MYNKIKSYIERKRTESEVKKIAKKMLWDSVRQGKIDVYTIGLDAYILDEYTVKFARKSGCVFTVPIGSLRNIDIFVKAVKKDIERREHLRNLEEIRRNESEDKKYRDLQHGQNAIIQGHI